MSQSIRVSCLLVFVCAPVLGQVPEQINWQGYLTDASGDPLTGSVGLSLRLFDAMTAGTQLFRKDTSGVVANEGVVNVPLGPFPGVDFSRPLFLEVRVGGVGALSPRSALTSVPYALTVRGFRVEEADEIGVGRAENVIAGASNNTISPNVVGATISGGGGIHYGDGPFPYPNVVGAESHWATIGGGEGNSAAGRHATLGGGYNNEVDGRGATIGGGEDNFASEGRTVVAGGMQNQASGHAAAVGGGAANRASGMGATIGGGGDNLASGVHSTVAGGIWNEAVGHLSFAAGANAHADHSGSFVWNDGRGADVVSGGPVFKGQSLSSTGPNQFIIGASGGVGIGTNDPATPLAINAGLGGRDVGLTQGQVGGVHTMELTTSDTDGDQATRLVLRGDGDASDIEFYRGGRGDEVMSMIIKGTNGRIGINKAAPGHPIEVGSDGTNGNGAYLSAGGTWTSKSSRTVKEGFDAVDTRRILQTVADLPVLRWRYAGSAEGVHIGPMAEDFHAAFGTGVDERAIAMVDADGVALAAIQGLYEIVQELRAENQELRARVDAMER